jgi:Fe-Mn family superoxide dismutase
MSNRASRRKFLKQALQGSAAFSVAAVLPSIAACGTTRNGIAAGSWLALPDQAPLPYAYNALEPVIDAQTMEIHYTKHAAAYAKNLNDAMAAEQVAKDTSMVALMAGISKYSPKMRNNGGGHYNHEFFWQCMKPGGTKAPEGSLLTAIQGQFGDFENFRKKFTEAAMTRFGSGWAWLYLDASNKVQVGSTPNQDNPLMDVSPIKGKPLLGLDVWEHAYYLKYQNRRADYVENWFKIVNWDFVARQL